MNQNQTMVEKIKSTIIMLFTTRKGKRNLWGYAFVLPALILFTAFTVIPIILSLSLSVTNMRGINMTDLTMVGLRNYKYIFEVDPYFWVSMKNIAIYTAITVPLTLTGSMLLALLIKKAHCWHQVL